MFVIKKTESFNKTIRMPEPLIEQLEEIASMEDISFNALVVQCCEYALAHLPNNNGKITCTEQFLKNKKNYKNLFIDYMKTKSPDFSETELEKMFTEAIFAAMPHNAELKIDLYDLLSDKISIKEYQNRLTAYFLQTQTNPADLTADKYASALTQLKEFLRHIQAI